MSDAELLFRELLDNLAGRARAPRAWKPLLQLASDTLTIGSLASVLLASDLEPELPDDVRSVLRDVLERAEERNRRLKDQFAELLAPLHAAGVEPIVMRGMASILADPGATGRLLSDIDLLVPADGREATVQTLTSLGYQIFQGFHGPPYSVVLARSRDVGMVDLHTNLQPYWLGVDYDRVAPLCHRAELDGRRFLVPNPTCAMLFYVLHDQLHDGDYWRGLIDARHIADFRRLVEAGIDWDSLFGFFLRGCALNALHVQLRTARSLLGVDIPEERCGGFWAKLQLRRRMVQLRFPFLMPVFTIVTLLADPPRSAGPKSAAPASMRKSSLPRRLRFKLGRAFGRVNPGKVQVRSS